MSALPAPITGTGLDYLQRIVSGEIPGVPIGDTLGFRLVEAEKGRVLQGGRRLAYGDARLVDAAGKLLCHGTGSCLIGPR